MKSYDYIRYGESPFEFSSVDVYNVTIYRPRSTIRESLEKEIESDFRESFKIGEYNDLKVINSIYQYRFKFYLNKLDKILPLVFCKDWLVYTLFQYEISGDIAEKFKSNKLNEADSKYWSIYGALIRQTSDFLCDKMIEHSSDTVDLNYDIKTQMENYDIAWICAENCVDIANFSNLIHMISPSDLIVRVLGCGNYPYLVAKSEETKFYLCHKRYQNQARKDIVLREKYLKNNTFEIDIKKHFKELDEPLKHYNGMSYSEILYLLTSISLSVAPITEPGRIPMIEQEDYFNQLVIKGGYSLDAVRKVFNAFALTKDKLKKQPREIWNYKQENRVSKKPFLEITYKRKKYLLWSNQKLNDFFNLLDLDVIFKNFPSELCDKAVRKAIESLSNQAGKWFELEVRHQFAKLDILGQSINERLKSPSSNRIIKCDIGEIDFLGLSVKDKSIVVLECKMLNSGFEIKSFRKTRDKFLDGKNSFAYKFAKKVNWVFDNIEVVKSILCERYGIDENKIGNKVNCAFITYYSSIGSCFFDNFPVISLASFIDEYSKSNNWFLSNGVRANRIENAEMDRLQSVL